ncbi:NACHT domain-containing protein [Tolypothrix sp. VBCCA 56010]|uniref:NACHT domain-containing protein n=1 Tax=Tolypothrix sp. VBCCA 56010 TaxID=3137731 RepID=UPI003D7CEE71
MPRFIQYWLLPLLQTFISNVALAYLVNRLQPSGNNNQTFLLMAVCIVAIIIINFWQSQSQQSQQNSVPANQNGMIGFLPLLGGVTLYSISSYLPTEYRQTVSYISLFLFAVGTVLPVGVLLPRKWHRRLIWTIPGAGLFITLYCLITSPIAAVPWSLLTAILVILAFLSSFIYGVINRVLESIKQWLEQMEPLVADLIVSKLWESTSPFQREYYQSLIYTSRDYQTQGLDKDRILKLQEVFVPLKIVTKEASLAGSRIIPQKKREENNPREKQIWDFLAAIGNGEPTFRRMAVLGAPGTGKTTLLRYLTLTYATKQQRKRHPKAPKLIPVLLYLKDVYQRIVNRQLSLAELISEQVKQQRKIQPLNPPPNWFAEKLRQNKCLVMLDGLDEVADEHQRRMVTRWVDEQMQAYPDTAFILTSRPFGYKSAQLQQEVTVLEVQPFSLKQIQQFIHNWYLETEVMSRAGEEDLGVQEEAKKQADDLIKRIKNSKPLADMAVNPLLLTMIATVHRRGSALPGKRVELYKEICQVLLERRLRAKNIGDALTATQKQSVLQVLALVLIQQKTRDFKLFEGISIIKNELETVAGSRVKPEDFLKQIRDVSGLLVEKELGVYEFAHLSFQEYLAAVQVKESNQENVLIKNINNSWWAETIRLYAAQSNATNIIYAILDIPSPSVEAMALAYDCLQEGLSVNPDVREELEQTLDADLESR